VANDNDVMIELIVSLNASTTCAGVWVREDTP
jgi:hypothetical protein